MLFCVRSSPSLRASSLQDQICKVQRKRAYARSEDGQQKLQLLNKMEALLRFPPHHDEAGGGAAAGASPPPLVPPPPQVASGGAG
jgi:hypothetical protein